MSALSAAYARIGNRFGIKGKYYGPDGHRGTDSLAIAGQGIPAWEGGVVVNHRASYYLGQTITIRLKDGAYAGYAHVGKTMRRARIGKTVKRGDIIGTVAGYDDEHGASWDGPHIHTTLGQRENAIFQGYVTDPLPRIQANLIAAQGVKYTVSTGDTLSGIGYRFGRSWLRIYNANKRVIGLNPNRLKVGTVLTIP